MAMKDESATSNDSGPLPIMVVDDEVALGRMLVRSLKSAGWTAEYFEDPREALQAARAGNYGLIISDIHMPNMTGIDLMRAVRRFDFDIPIILLTGAPSIDTAKKAVELGAFRYLTKPADSAELQAALRKAAFNHRIAKIRRKAMDLQGQDEARPSDLIGLDVALDDALDSLWMAYQPIVRGKDGSVFSYEALMRSESKTRPHPGAILAAAEKVGRLDDVGRRVREIAPLPFLDRDDDVVLFVNLHPRDLLDKRLLDRDTPLGKLSSRVVLEITERASFDAIPDAQETIAYLRLQRYRIAVDDLGSGYSGLTSFATLEPDFVKLDMALIRDVDTNVTKQKLVRSIVELCRDMGVVVVAEGIETVSERDRCVELGVDLLQGYFIAKPGKAFPEVRW